MKKLFTLLCILVINSNAHSRNTPNLSATKDELIPPSKTLNSPSVSQSLETFDDTTCPPIAYPFWEGFNTNSPTIACWTMLNNSNNDRASLENWYFSSSFPYEGNRSISFIGFNNSNDVWLISPDLILDGSTYIIKYQYRTYPYLNNQVEVLLSDQGKNLTDFTHTILSTTTYQEVNWTEEEIRIEGFTGTVNLAWHISSESELSIELDDISVRRVSSCPEPINLTLTNATTTTITASWEPDNRVTSWQVDIFNRHANPYIDRPVNSITVTTPTATFRNLPSGQVYDLYVKANCSPSSSLWSSPLPIATVITTNDDCSNPQLIPVNLTSSCTNYISGTLLGATPLQTLPLEYSCHTSLQRDVWFQFTATAKIHQLEISNIETLFSNSNFALLSIGLYEQDCDSISRTPVACYITNESIQILPDLIPGQTYYIQVSDLSNTPESENSSDIIFDLCITTSAFSPLEITPLGEEHSLDYLVNNVLIDTDCNLASNIHYQNGDGSPAPMSFNTLGFFNKGNADFPFEKGLVLVTNEIQYVTGPSQPSSFSFRGTNDHRWHGDQDINSLINETGGGLSPIKRVTQLAFDFIPTNNEISFEYLFASNSYDSGCGVHCSAGALFATWLIDTTTGEGQNLAKVEGTDLPISIRTVLDTSKTESLCTSSYPELYGKHYNNIINKKIDAPIDFIGLTKAMKSKKATVIPGRRYQIKFAVIDFCPTTAHSTAVFFNAGSFKIGAIDLGIDRLNTTDNPLCENECITLDAKLDPSVTDITWYKDGVILPDEKQANLTICESGQYKVVAPDPIFGCLQEGNITIEFTPSIFDLVQKPNALKFCQKYLSDKEIDLTAIEDDMFLNVDPSKYKVRYYLTEESALQEEDEIINGLYMLSPQAPVSVFYLKITDLKTGCQSVTSFPIHYTTIGTLKAPANFNSCENYIFPPLQPNQYYYDQPQGQGKNYMPGDIITTHGQHTFYLLQKSSEEDCYLEVAFQVYIEKQIEVDKFDDIVVHCDYYELPPLSDNNRYFTKPNGKGKELVAGTIIIQKSTIYIYASSPTSHCILESEFLIDFDDCPIPRGFSPNGDQTNDAFDLSKHNVQSIKIYNRYGMEVYSHGIGYTNQWEGQNKQGNKLPSGTYYYVIITHNKQKTGWVKLSY